MNNIFIDGSYNHENKLIGIGVYNSSNGFELSMVKNGENVSEAEYEALQECLRYCKMNNIIKTVEYLLIQRKFTKHFMIQF